MVTLIRNSLILVGLMVVAYVLLQENMGLLTKSVHQARSEFKAAPARAPSRPPPVDRGHASSDGSQLVIEAGPGGHFHLDTEIAGREIGFLVDTGASSVALSEEDADDIGIPIHQLDYSGRANTANGIARFAPVMIDEITIGDHVVRNVQGVVIEGHTGESLLGMTFLRKLRGYEVKDDRLILRW